MVVFVTVEWCFTVVCTAAYQVQGYPWYELWNGSRHRVSFVTRDDRFYLARAYAPVDTVLLRRYQVGVLYY